MCIQGTFITPENVSEWQDAHRFALGNSSGPAAGAVAAVGISLGLEARWRVDLFAGVGYSYFQDVRCIGDQAYIGYGQQVAVFSPTTGSLVSHPLDGYFGRLVTASDLETSDLGSSVLVASASELLCFDWAGHLLWRSSGLGVDGVVVQRVQGGEIVGDAEWDPPGGWKPFRLRLDSGAVVGAESPVLPV